MKKSIVIAALALAFVSAAGATEPVSPPAASASGRAVEDLADQLEKVQDQVADLEKRLDVVERRLGDTYQTPSPFDTIEKRLEAVEEDLDDSKRR